MTRSYIFFLLTTTFLMLGVFACTKPETKTANGFPYEILLKGEGEKISYGQHVLLSFSIATPDTVLFTAREKNVLLRDPSRYSAKIKDPVLDILPLLHVGDSATLLVKVDDLMRLTDNLKDVEELTYTVVVKGVQTKEERKEAEYNKRNRQKELKLDALQRKSLAMQEDPVGGMAYQSLRTCIASHQQDPRTKLSESGLEYIILDSGQKPYCQGGEDVTVHYIGMQEEGLVFDETYSSQQTFTFALNRGRVIKAWDEAIQLLGVNGEAFLKVPPKLGYGATGVPPLIRPNATLFFHIKVLNVEQK